MFSTIPKKYSLDANGRLYEKTAGDLRLIRLNERERVYEIACGGSHTILRTTSKKIYTFGSGRKGQLGHGNMGSEEQPRLVKFFEQMKTYTPLQVAASFNSSIVLLSNHKVYWFGTNGTIKMCLTPTLMQLKDKVKLF